MRIYQETVEHHTSKVQGGYHPFKTESKLAEVQKKLNKISFLLKAELEMQQGEEFFQHATQIEENLNMDEVYDALDSFNHASKIAFEHNDIELEAKCEAWLGKIYAKCLKKDSKAMTHYNNVVRLANSLKPRDVTKTQWYKDSKTGLDKIREAREREEEA